jgi:transposase InsO family protein
VAAKRPAKGLMHHSDRGSQYCSYEFRQILDRFGLVSIFDIRNHIDWIEEALEQ